MATVNINQIDLLNYEGQSVECISLSQTIEINPKNILITSFSVDIEDNVLKVQFEDDINSYTYNTDNETDEDENNHFTYEADEIINEFTDSLKAYDNEDIINDEVCDKINKAIIIILEPLF